MDPFWGLLGWHIASQLSHRPRAMLLEVLTAAARVK